MATDEYIDGYGRTDIHADMIGDRVRTTSYRRAILDNAPRIEGRTVLDVGCGTGILSLFAAEAGAAKVYGVEASAMANVAREVVAHNGLADRITIVRGKLEDIELPEKVDVLISEWMGYFLIFERMLDSVLVARDRWLKPGGLILPGSARLRVAGIEDFELEAKRFGWWHEVYGFDLSPVSDYCRMEPLIDNADPNSTITDTCTVLDLSVADMSVDEQDFGRTFELTALRTETLHALVSWFDVSFSTPDDPIVLSTSPDGPSTHWKQTIFYLPRPLKVRKGERLKCRIEVERDAARPRSLRIRLEVRGAAGKRESSYYL